jgi:hypothetical protein
MIDEGNSSRQFG